MLKAVIFDMDGVIVDTEPLHRKAYYSMFEAVGINVSDSLYESFTGQATLNICKQLCNQFHLVETPQTLVNLKRQFFKSLFQNDGELDLIEGVLKLIQDYHKNGLKLTYRSFKETSKENG